MVSALGIGELSVILTSWELNRILFFRIQLINSNTKITEAITTINIIQTLVITTKYESPRENKNVNISKGTNPELKRFDDGIDVILWNFRNWNKKSNWCVEPRMDEFQTTWTVRCRLHDSKNTVTFLFKSKKGHLKKINSMAKLFLIEHALYAYPINHVTNEPWIIWPCSFKCLKRTWRCIDI